MYLTAEEENIENHKIDELINVLMIKLWSKLLDEKRTLEQRRIQIMRFAS